MDLPLLEHLPLTGVFAEWIRLTFGPPVQY